jgi:hypothetical protein
MVDNVGDQVFELPNQGTDTVISLLSTYQLPDNVEIGSIGLTTGATLEGHRFSNC